MEYINSRPIIVVSNSSWYLYHYRKLLIKEIKKTNNHILAIAPYDSTSKYLSELLVHIPWRMSRSNNQNLISFLISFFRMLLLIRAIKPKIIHSHTLQANFITSIVGCFFGINCVFSFAGIGRFSKTKRHSKLFFFFIFKIINFFNSYQRVSTFTFKKNLNRTAYIFQNQCDIDLIKKETPQIKKFHIYLIPGSGVPNIYISKSNLFTKNTSWSEVSELQDETKLLRGITFLYCARLLKSKGILIFIELSKIYPKNKFIIFGSIDKSSKDSLTSNEVSFYQNNYKNITFISNKKDPLLSIKNKKAVLIVPSFYGEGFPRGIIEANTLSIPVIASQDTSKRIPIKNIFYVSKNDTPKGYVKCINEIIKDYKNKNLYKKLENARKVSIDNFSEKLIVKKTLKIYELFSKEKNKSYLLTKDKKRLNNWLAQ